MNDWIKAGLGFVGGVTATILFNHFNVKDRSIEFANQKKIQGKTFAANKKQQVKDYTVAKKDQAVNWGKTKKNKAKKSIIKKIKKW